MAFSAIPIFQGFLTTTLTTVLATVTSGKTWIVRDIEIVNTDSAIHTFTLSMPGAGAAHELFAGLSINPSETVQWQGNLVLSSATTICGGADVGSLVTVTISGAEG